MVVPRPTKPMEPPFPRWYNSNAKCEFHNGAEGHSLEECMAFKVKVQELIDAKWLPFKEDGPNVKSNPLPGYGEAPVNAIEESTNFNKIESVEENVSEAREAANWLRSKYKS
ncbi:hypothetical protein A2U01_0047354 [Trifolium medium]|uniref:Gag-pol polyprotein n=1 Tax=Trifolium medium TaxID=97028 RepID=A0A392QQC0_9FABA|nr:hypothetical protein [Trifolium medium]